MERMKAGLLITLLVAVAVAPGVAVATDRPDSFDFEFTYPENPGTAPVEILDNFVQWFPLTVPEELPIDYLELEITGLSHSAPMDLNIFLLHTSFGGIELMDEAGDQHAIQDVTLLFADKGIGLPHGVEEGALQSFPDTIYRPDGPGTLSQFNMMGPGTWYLVIIDDAPGDVGSFESVTLRGTVPEPATLSLLALGALAIMRCRRRRR
jgi:hypothetical protein